MVTEFHRVDFLPQIGDVGRRVFERKDLDGDDAIGRLVSSFVHLCERSLEEGEERGDTTDDADPFIVVGVG